MSLGLIRLRQAGFDGESRCTLDAAMGSEGEADN